MQLGQIGVAAAPVDLREAKIQPAQGAAYGHIGQRKLDAGAKRFVFEQAAHFGQTGLHLAQLAIHPCLAALLRLAAFPVLLQPRQDACVQHAVGQGFPDLDGQPIAPRGRYQAAHGAQGVEVFHNHARIVQRHAGFGQQQARHLAQRVVLQQLGRRLPGVCWLESVFELFLGQHNAHLAYIGTGSGADQFHAVVWRVKESGIVASSCYRQAQRAPNAPAA